MADSISDSDIIKALQGDTDRADASREAIVRVLRGESSEEDAFRRSIGETFGRKEPASRESGQRTEGDAVALWSANDWVKTATKTLAESLMKNAGKTYWEAEAEALQIADEAYIEAAKRSPYEVDRKETVARAVTKLAEVLARPSTPKPKAGGASGTIKQPNRQESQSPKTKHVRITEGGTGRIKIIS